MDEGRRYRIAQLAMAETAARRRWEALGLVNTHVQDFEGQKQLDADYALARAEWVDALAALREAVYESAPDLNPLARAAQGNPFAGRGENDPLSRFYKVRRLGD